MIINYNKLLKQDPYNSIKYKNNLYLSLQKQLTRHHLLNCKEYKNISQSLFKEIRNIKKIEELPYLHTNIFKKFDLRSVKKKTNELVMQSSGTTNQEKSKINLDFQNTLLQSKVLEKILFNFIPKNISKIIIIDNEETFYNRSNFSAKNAAIRGFAQFFKKKIFLFNKDYTIKKNIIDYIRNNDNVLYFGFTSIVWDKFLKFYTEKKITNHKNSFFIHGGGWKKLEEIKINRLKLNLYIKKILGIKKTYNYYGMVEQTGSIFMECDHGFYHPSIFSDVIIRDLNLNIQKINEVGLIQVMSVLPTSYPGHNLLTEDLGRIIGLDKCKCGRKGKYFEVMGRVKNTELRGCSDAR